MSPTEDRCGTRLLASSCKRLQAAAVCQTYHQNRAWTLIESATVMEDIWTQVATPGIAFMTHIFHDCHSALAAVE